MKQILFAIILLGISPIHPAQQPPYPPQPYPPIVINNNLGATAQSQAQGATNTPIVTTITQQLPQLQSQIQDTLSLSYKTLIQYLKDHWLLCSVVTASSVYAALLVYLLYAEHALHNLYYWSKWRHEEDLESLMKKPSQAIAEALVKDIAARYINPENPTDVLWSLSHFMQTIEYEECMIKRYITCTSIIKKTPFFRILPTLQDQYAQEALNRLHFVYHLFTTWAAELTWERLKNGGNPLCTPTKSLQLSLPCFA